MGEGTQLVADTSCRQLCWHMACSPSAAQQHGAVGLKAEIKAAISWLHHSSILSPHIQKSGKSLPLQFAERYQWVFLHWFLPVLLSTQNIELWNRNTWKERDASAQLLAQVLTCLQTPICHVGGSRERQAPCLQPLLPALVSPWQKSGWWNSCSTTPLLVLQGFLWSLQPCLKPFLKSQTWVFCCLAAWRSWEKSVSTDPKCTWTLLSSKKGVSLGAVYFVDVDSGVGSNMQPLKKVVWPSSSS